PAPRPPALSPLSLHDALPIYPSLPTANRAPDGGVYPVTVTATADGVSAPQSQGLHLVPRLVAARTEGVEIDARRDSGEYPGDPIDRKSTRLNSSHVSISYAVF